MDMIQQDHISIGKGIGIIHSDHIGMVVSVEPYQLLLSLLVDNRKYKMKVIQQSPRKLQNIFQIMIIHTYQQAKSIPKGTLVKT